LIARINWAVRGRFPVYKKSLQNGDVIKFTEETSGVIVSKGYPDSGRPVGYYSSGWIRCNAGNWQDLSDTEVELLGLPVLHCTLKKRGFV
jgi:hypothetical protein